MEEKRQYIFNLETTKIELHFEKTEYNALSDQQKKELKSSFLWSNKGKCWVSRAKEPNLWRAKQVAESLGFEEEQRAGERLSFAEQLENKAERAEARAERYEQYAANATARGENLQKEFNGYQGDVAFWTQPNINTSSGRAFTNYRERLYARYEKGFEEYRKSDYFKDRADTARATAANYKLDNKAYLERKIKECQKNIKSRTKNIVYYEELLYSIEKGEEKKNYKGEIITIEKVKEYLSREIELVEVEMDKQAFFENRLDELGGIQFNKDNIKIGYIVDVERWGNCEVVSVGKINFTAKLRTGGALKFSFAEIKEIIKAEEKQAEVHPFEVGQQFNAKVWNDSEGKYTFADYEIIKTTDKSITLQRIGTDEKPINRKPVKTYSGDEWRFSVNENYGSTFYRKSI